jgi:hypothetical protein
MTANLTHLESNVDLIDHAIFASAELGTGEALLLFQTILIAALSAYVTPEEMEKSIAFAKHYTKGADA